MFSNIRRLDARLNYKGKTVFQWQMDVMKIKRSYEAKADSFG